MNHFTFCLPIDDRPTSYKFYQAALGLEPVGEAAEDGIPEPLQFAQQPWGYTATFADPDGHLWSLTSL